LNPAILSALVIPVRQTTQAGEIRNRSSDRHQDLRLDPPVNGRMRAARDRPANVRRILDSKLIIACVLRAPADFVFC
jgi:hypothetical protein